MPSTLYDAVRVAGEILKKSIPEREPGRKDVAAEAATEDTAQAVVALLADGSWTGGASRAAQFERELGRLFRAKGGVQVRRVTADWTAAGARSALQVLIEDPGVSAVVTTGPLASHLAWEHRRGAAAKPLVEAGMLVAPEEALADGEE